MALNDYIAITEPVPDEATKLDFAQDLLGNQSRFNFMTSGGGGLPFNRSLEFDLDSDGEPDGWDVFTYTNGVFSIESSSVYDGAKAAKFTQTVGGGNGGGYITSDFMPVSPGGTYSFDFAIETSAALHVKGQVLWYDESKSLVGTNTLVDITVATKMRGITTSGTVGSINFAPRFAKVRIIGGFDDTSVSGTAIIDGVRFVQDDLNNVAVFEGQEFTEAGVSYVTKYSFKLFVPAGATQLDIDVDLKSSTVTFPAQARLKMSSLTGTPQTTTSTAYVTKTLSIDLDTSAVPLQDIVEAVEIQIAHVNGTATVQLVAGGSGVFEDKVVLS